MNMRFWEVCAELLKCAFLDVLFPAVTSSVVCGNHSSRIAQQSANHEERQKQGYSFLDWPLEFTLLEEIGGFLPAGEKNACYMEKIAVQIKCPILLVGCVFHSYLTKKRPAEGTFFLKSSNSCSCIYVLSFWCGWLISHPTRFAWKNGGTWRSLFQYNEVHLEVLIQEITCFKGKLFKNH